MKILLVHNRYQHPGGENVVFEVEGELLTSQGHIVERLIFDNSSIRTFIDKVLLGIKVIYNQWSAERLSQKIESFGPDIIHVHNFFPLASPSIFFVAKKYNIPIIMTLHNYRLICPSATLVYEGKIYERSISSVFPLDAIRKGVYRSSSLQTAAAAMMVAFHNLAGTWRNSVDLYIALSHFAKEKFRTSALAIPEERLAVKSNFVRDFGVGHARRDEDLLFVGRLVEEKGIRILLQAAQLYPIKLTIIGDGPLRNLVTNAAELNPNIRYLGFQDQGTIAMHMKKCKALIFPSIWYEGFPLTILEAFSTGTLVIASRLGAMPEIIQDGINGLLFEYGNPAALVEKIREMEDSSELASTIGLNARSSYLAHYTPERNYSLLLGIYKRALTRKRQRQNKMVERSAPIAGFQAS